MKDQRFFLRVYLLSFMEDVKILIGHEGKGTKYWHSY